MADRAGRRRAGLLVPLFAAPSANSWGIGDIGDLPLIARWLAAAGQRVLQLLPLNEMAPGQHSPYSAISAMAIDPLFICVSGVPDFAALGGEQALGRDERETLAHVRTVARIDYANVRRLKQKALLAAFSRFFDVEWRHDTARARALKMFVSEQAWWIEDYAIFRAIHASERERPWTSWSGLLQRRDPAAIGRARRELSRGVLLQQYLQWIADSQWKEARARARGVEIFGDLPFMVDGDSADVWARQDQFRLDLSLGAPPDEFSAVGQDWGMPVYRWDAVAAQDFRWLRERAQRSADLYNGYRVDHVVGFYRTYGRPREGGEGFFTPATERDQVALGETVIGVLRAAGAEVVAEDLGTVPDFVRASLGRLGVPGFRVFRWERYWHVEGRPFRDPSEYPSLSVATSGTHDTEPLMAWWQRTSEEDRRNVNDLPTMQKLTGGEGILHADQQRLRDALLEALFASGSDLVLLPVQDLFGWPVRINEPGTISESNWTFRLPWPCDRWDEIAEARERCETLRRWSADYQRR